jgi:hypothetical protein
MVSHAVYLAVSSGRYLDNFLRSHHTGRIGNTGVGQHEQADDHPWQDKVFKIAVIL